ncbi:hypothetical protein R3P38DRAFT_3629305 [Favolaschia claudopus]|uniref:Uncharacterized protein n=1 Tax=Favolaschia claudopus TaxID=2862362 RepID=A0AAV9ZZT0_9AGAR
MQPPRSLASLLCLVVVFEAMLLLPRVYLVFPTLAPASLTLGTPSRRLFAQMYFSETFKGKKPIIDFMGILLRMRRTLLARWGSAEGFPIASGSPWGWALSRLSSGGILRRNPPPKETPLSLILQRTLRGPLPNEATAEVGNRSSTSAQFSQQVPATVASIQKVSRFFHGNNPRRYRDRAKKWQRNEPSVTVTVAPIQGRTSGWMEWKCDGHGHDDPRRVAAVCASHGHDGTKLRKTAKKINYLPRSSPTLATVTVTVPSVASPPAVSECHGGLGVASIQNGTVAEKGRVGWTRKGSACKLQAWADRGGGVDMEVKNKRLRSSTSADPQTLFSRSLVPRCELRLRELASGASVEDKEVEVNSFVVALFSLLLKVHFPTFYVIILLYFPHLRRVLYQQLLALYHHFSCPTRPSLFSRAWLLRASLLFQGPRSTLRTGNWVPFPSPSDSQPNADPWASARLSESAAERPISTRTNHNSESTPTLRLPIPPPPILLSPFPFPPSSFH